MISPSTGVLLVAHPFLKDHNFLKSVVLICEHNHEGSFGLVLNKRISPTLDQLVEGFKGLKIPVYSGGPMEPEKLFFIHQYPDLIPDGIRLTPDIYWGGNFQTLASLIINNDINPDKVKFFVGYSGWSEGQLNEELMEKSWVTVDATKKIVYDTPTSLIWKDSLKYLGGEYEMMINFPSDPQLN